MRRIGIPLALLPLWLGLAAPMRAEDATPSGGAAPTRRDAPLLEEAYAAFRGQQVAGVRYRLRLDLASSEERYAGEVEIAFELRHARAPLTIDFAGGEVRSVELDGAVVPYHYGGSFIEIPVDRLAPGARRLRIAYSHPFSSDGSGFARFRDPEDGSVYVNTDFEPYYANRLFPCFDQPDLKARYRLTVDAPADWLVASAVRESSVTPTGAGRRWEFPETKRFSTYVFSLVAGPFHVWESRAGDVPLRLMARRSLADHVPVEEWFRVTQQGLAFFGAYFGIAYPFGKYDQVLVPDFLWGAMENVGNVTFSERFVRRGRYTAGEREDLANVILHEMAHMWFGDLVTMRWWNGLWLNESFANYMASFALAGATEYEDAWLSFFTGSEIWAYTSDESVTTHAIDLPVADTAGAFANFDGITYGKGAAVLKQLVHLVGEEAFQRAVRGYLARHAYANTELTDFIGAVSEASGRDLDAWVEEWLYRPGLDSVAVESVCDAGSVERIVLRQGSIGVAPLRLHRLQVGAFEAGEDGRLRAVATEPVLLSGATAELAPSAPLSCDAFLYPNYGDWAFIKVLLDDATSARVAGRVGRFEPPLQRAMLWRARWEEVRDARVPLTLYLDAVLEQLPEERSRQILSQVLNDARAALVFLRLFGPDFAAVREHVTGRLEALAWQQIQALQADPDLQMLWFDHLLSIASTATALDRLAGLLDGTLELPGLLPDQDRRWAIVTRLSSAGYTGWQALSAAETARDPSDNGRKAAIAGAAADPALPAKREWLSRIQRGDGAYRLADLRVVMSHLLPGSQPEARRALLAEVLAPLPELDAARDSSFLEPYVSGLASGYCSAASESALIAALEANRGASVSTSRGLRVALQEDQRCLEMKRRLAAAIAAPGGD